MHLTIIRFLFITILLSVFTHPLWSQSLKEQFENQEDDLLLNLNRQIKDSGFLKRVDRSWNDFEKYVLNYKDGVYEDTYTFHIPNVWDKNSQKRIDIVDQFFRCSGHKSYRNPKKLNPDIFFHTDGKLLVSSIPYDWQLSQSQNNIELKLVLSSGGIRLFDKLGSVNKKVIKSNCQDVYIELENPLKAYANVTNEEKENFYFKDAKSGKPYKGEISYGWKSHARFISLFVARQCDQIEILSRSYNQISKTEEAKRIKSKIMNKIEQHKRYILWSFKKEEIRYKLDENNLCSNFSF